MNNWARNSVGRYAPMGATADDLPAAPPSGKKTIDSTTEVDVSAYATAQVVDENLVAGNIKKDVEVLGILGEFEGGGGGGGNYTTATMTITAKGAYAGKNFAIPNLFTYEGTDFLNPSVNIDEGTYTVLLLNGRGSAYFDPNLVENPWDITVTGDAEYADGYLDYTGDFSIAFGSHS